MKKLNMFIIALCLLLALSGCNKSEKTSQTQSEAKQSSTAVEPQKKITTINSIALYEGTPLYVENADGKMVYKDEMLLGESLKIYFADDQMEQKEAIRLLSSGKEESFNFVHVSYYDNDYWTRDIFITDNTKLQAGIILSDTLTYSAADGTSATSKKLEEGTIVAVDPESKQTDTDLDIDFINVTYYSGTAFGKTAFIKTDSVSYNAADIVANQTLSRILANDSLKPEIEDLLFDYLETIGVSSYMEEKIKAAYDEVLNRRN